MDKAVSEWVDFGEYEVTDEDVKVASGEYDISGGIFYLWDTNIPVWEIFNLVRMYLTMDANGNWWMPVELVMQLITRRNLPFEETLEQVHIMFSSYLSEMLYRTKKD